MQRLVDADPETLTLNLTLTLTLTLTLLLSDWRTPLHSTVGARPTLYPCLAPVICIVVHAYPVHPSIHVTLSFVTILWRLARQPLTRRRPVCPYPVFCLYRLPVLPFCLRVRVYNLA